MVTEFTLPIVFVVWVGFLCSSVNLRVGCFCWICWFGCYFLFGLVVCCLLLLFVTVWVGWYLIVLIALVSLCFSFNLVC